MSLTPDVSVVLSVRNGGADLPGAVATILAQTFVNFELIAIDNGSTDETAALAAEMQRMMTSPVLLKQLGAAGQQAWRDRFTWVTIAKYYERVLRGEKDSAPLLPQANPMSA